MLWFISTSKHVALINFGQALPTDWITDCIIFEAQLVRLSNIGCLLSVEGNVTIVSEGCNNREQGLQSSYLLPQSMRGTRGLHKAQ